MARRPRQFYSLKRPKVRASWNLRNLYNLSRLRKQFTIGGSTFYQQKYEAKQLTRAYHGEQIREGKWERMFTRYLPSVVEMDARKLAVQDGVEQAAGRGAGKDAVEEDQKNKTTPYMQMTYWMNERRLDTAIFRSLFASSLRQARQMVVHGHVKVNGKKFIHPSYLLNPGDMFSVDPDLVLFATSNTGVAAQQSPNRSKSKPSSKAASAEAEVEAETETSEVEATTKDNIEASSQEAITTQPAEVAEKEEKDLDPDWTSLPAQPAEAEAEEDDNDLELPAKRGRPSGPPQILDPAVIKSHRATLKELYDLTRETEDTHEPSAKQKIELRGMRKRMRAYVARPWRMSEQDIDDVAEELEVLLMAIEERAGPKSARAPAGNNDDDGVLDLEQTDGKRPSFKQESRAAVSKVNQHMNALAGVEGEWFPKDYMAPFAFIPRYLEVNHTVCSAVYLRHPVARMGLAEVPTPFALETGNLAFSYYLRRR